MLIHIMPTISPFWSTQHQYFPQLNIVPTFSPLWTLPDMVESYVDKMRMERQDIDFYVGKLKGRHGDKDNKWYASWENGDKMLI